jgi:hypothetical protein
MFMHFSFMFKHFSSMFKNIAFKFMHLAKMLRNIADMLLPSVCFLPLQGENALHLVNCMPNYLKK